MRLTKITMLLFELNHALDTGKYGDISKQEVYEAIRTASVPQLLKRHLGDDVDLSLHTPEDWADFHEEWESMVNAIDPSRKFGVSNNGLCLLIAYLIQRIQSGSFEPREKP
jgi:hypothetical protein